jgi:hypothetical protein
MSIETNSARIAAAVDAALANIEMNSARFDHAFSSSAKLSHIRGFRQTALSFDSAMHRRRPRAGASRKFRT